MKMKQFLSGAALTALTLSMASAAQAQSTGSQQFEEDEIIVTGTRGSLAGTIVAERNPRSRATVTEEYLATQGAGQTAMNSINLLPGVNFNNSDAYGSSGGDITIRGFDASRISLTVDGIPLNDTGNYAIYTNQQPDPEILTRIAVNLGTTEVDSPTASATGGTVNMVTRLPSEDFGVTTVFSVGENDFRRVFLSLDTGTLGPLDTSAWFSFSQTGYDNFNAIHGVEKTQYNARVYQPLGANGDFLSVIFHYNENRNFFGNQSVTLAAFNNGAGYNRPTPAAGGVFTGFNPSNTGNIRAQSRFTLAPGLRLTIDPTFQYVLANGGGNNNWTRAQLDLIGGPGTGDAVFARNGLFTSSGNAVLHRPNNTNTQRYTVTSSLIWDINPDHLLRAAYTYEHGRHRQTGEQGYMQSHGYIETPFAGISGEPVRLADGTNLRRRDRLSYAILNQFAVEYRGSFFETVDLNIGLRAPFFERELNNYCYQRDTFEAYCVSDAYALANRVDNGDGTYSFPVTGPFNSSAANRYGAPRSFTKEYDAVLPNLGVNWRFAPDHTVYFSYAEGISAPRTDDLYDRVIPDPKPERTASYDLGYRFQTSNIIASAAIWRTDYDNRIVRTFDEVEDIYLSRNVGEVTLQGIDGQIGWSPIESLTLYASASYVDSEVHNDLPDGFLPDGVTPRFIGTAGNQLVEIPDWQFGVRADYEIGNFRFGIQGKYVGERFANDINTAKSPDYTIWDLDARYTLPWGSESSSWLQLNVVNLFDERYLANINTSTTGLGTYNLGAPRTVMLTLRTAL